MGSCFHCYPPSRFPKGCRNYEDLEPEPAFAPLSRLQGGCKGRQDRASFILCLWIIPLADPQAETFYIHITDGQRQKSSRRCGFSIYPKQRQTGSGCLGCYRHPALSGKLLVIAWLLVCFSPPVWTVCDIFRKATAICAVLYVEIHISSEKWGILHGRRNQDLSKSPHLYCATLIVSHLFPHEKSFCISTPNSTCFSSNLIIFDFQIWLVFHGLILH